MDIKTRAAANPLIVLAIGVTAVSFSALLVRMVSAPPAVTAFWRLFFTCLILAPFARKDELTGISRRDFFFCLLGGLFLALHFSFWFASLAWTSISSSTLLVNIHPLVVVSLGWFFFGERVRLKAVPGALIALAGMALLGWGDMQLTGDTLKGDLWAAAGGLMIAGYYLVGRTVRVRVNLAAYSLLVYGASAVFLLAFNLSQGAGLLALPLGDWILFAALAIVPTIGGHTLLNWALGHLPAAAVSVSVLGEPVIATLLAIALFTELPGPTQVAGGIAVLAGIWFFLANR